MAQNGKSAPLKTVACSKSTKTTKRGVASNGADSQFKQAQKIALSNLGGRKKLYTNAGLFATLYFKEQAKWKILS